ncbi:tetratricopeptide repeat protein [Ruegeria sp. HKCCA0370]|uniref:tetratricopeptide repeat protein n=1 Tax=Ruegeria sp. HKCCA0370 TaxID=2682995 RepID=UPI001489185C|nr:tetratricopeptide repeat protein [Ruegeria sp. HKCCA0370]
MDTLRLAGKISVREVTYPKIASKLTHYLFENMTETKGNSTCRDKSGNDLSVEEKRAAVASVVESRIFANSPRLKEFLIYVTEKSLSEEGADLSAKSIGFHLYGRDTVDETNSANFVRVEAGRLRRSLDDYYDSDGRADAVRVQIRKGGYAPTFERHVVSAQSPAADGTARPLLSGGPKKLRLVLFACVLLAVIALGVFEVLRPGPRPDDAELAARVERQALMEQSPAALEAANMALQARGLIYPIFDAHRQMLTTELFRAAIEIDPNSALPYAGAAQTLGSLALLSIAGARHDNFLAEAREMRDRALELDADHEWVQSAAGWVAFVERDFESAMRYSERALSLAPENGNVLDFYGVVAVASGEFEKGLQAGDRDRPREGENTRFAYLNILGAAYFHLGLYHEAISAFEEGNASGGPVSALGVVYLAAAYSSVGREQDGRRMIDQIEKSWPGFPIEEFLTRLHREPDTARQLVKKLRSVGWSE